MRALGIIPARSGSKGLPNKNIIDLCGRPLIDYTIKAALQSGCFEEVMVSTDSREYAEIAEKCGASVPFLRSDEMSSDNASSWDAVREILRMYKEQGKTFDYIALLQPTSPLRDAEDIANTFKMLSEESVQNISSVVEVEHPVQWCFAMPDNCSMEEFASSPYAFSRRQDLEKHYIENGAIFLVRADKIVDTSYNFYKDNCYGYVMAREKSIDIDTAVDLKLAEFLLQEKMVK